MRFSHNARRGVALLSLVSLLFMQLSVAAYACVQGVPQATAAVAFADSEETATMVDCAQMDPEQMLLCHTHCHGQELSVDLSIPAPPALPAVDLVATLAFEQSQDALSLLLQADFTTSGLLNRATAPPARVLNCCFLN